MKKSIVLVTFLTSLSLQAGVFCKNEVLNVDTIINSNLNVLDELYNGRSSIYAGTLCGVEDTADLCFTGSDKEAARLLESYYSYAYEYDDEIGSFFVKYANGDFNSVTLFYKEQGSRLSFNISKCQ